MDVYYWGKWREDYEQQREWQETRRLEHFKMNVHDECNRPVMVQKDDEKFKKTRIYLWFCGWMSWNWGVLYEILIQIIETCVLGTKAAGWVA